MDKFNAFITKFSFDNSRKRGSGVLGFKIRTFPADTFMPLMR